MLHGLLLAFYFSTIAISEWIFRRAEADLVRLGYLKKAPELIDNAWVKSKGLCVIMFSPCFTPRVILAKVTAFWHLFVVICFMVWPAKMSHLVRLGIQEFTGGKP